MPSHPDNSERAGPEDPTRPTTAAAKPLAATADDTGENVRCTDPATCQCSRTGPHMRRDGCEERAREGRAHTTMQWWRYQHARLAAPRPSSGGRCGPCGTLGHEQLASWVARQLCPCRDGAVANRVDQLIAAGYTDEQIARMIGATSS